MHLDEDETGGGDVDGMDQEETGRSWEEELLAGINVPAAPAPCCSDFQLAEQHDPIRAMEIRPLLQSRRGFTRGTNDSRRSRVQTAPTQEEKQRSWKHWNGKDLKSQPKNLPRAHFPLLMVS